MSPIRALLINLERSPDRLAFMREQCARLGMGVERIEAVEGANVPEWLASEFEGPHQLTPGEVGCYASHLLAAQRIVAEGLPFALVLEDDVVLADDFVQVAADAVAKAPRGWDFLHLSSVHKKTLVHIADLACGHGLVRYSRLPLNTGAYVISNAGARKFLRPVLRVRPVDVDIRYAWEHELNVLGVYPALATLPEQFQSEIGGTRGRNWSPGVVSSLYGTVWLATRFGLLAYVQARALTYWNSLRKRIDGKRRVAILKDKSCRRGAGTEPVRRLFLRSENGASPE